MALNFDQLNEAFDEIQRERESRKAVPQSDVPKLDPFALDILEALRVFKQRGVKTVRVGEIGRLLRRAGCTRTDENLYPLIAKICRDDFKLVVIPISSGILFDMPRELPVLN